MPAGGLHLLWLACLGVAGAAILMMLTLVVRRLWIDRRASRRNARRQHLISEILTAIDPQTARPLSGVASDGDRRLLAEIGRELMDIMRGEDRGRLLAVLENVGVVAVMLADIQTGSAHQRADAAAFLAPFDRPDCRAALVSALEGDPRPAVRVAAAFGLAEWGALPPLPQVVAALDAVGALRSRRVMSLFRKLAARVPAQLADLGAGAPDPAMLVLILDALAQAGYLDALPLMLSATSHPKLDVRAEAFRALAQLGHPAAEQAVACGLDDPAWPVRAQAALCVGKVGIAALKGRLLVLLGDAEWWVRYRAAEALAELGPSGLDSLRVVSRQATAAGRIAQLILSEREGMA